VAVAARKLPFGLVVALLACLAGLLYVLPALLHGQDTPVLVRDLLDSTFTWLKVLADRDLLWADALTPVEVLPTLRGYLPGPLAPQALLLEILPPYPALVVHDALVHALAFAGMALLARDLLARLDAAAPAALWALPLAAAFAALPFFLGAGISVAGQPLLLWALLGLRRGQGGWRWLVPPLFALGSSLVLAGLFLALALTAWVLGELLAGQRRAALRLALALLGLTLGYLVGEQGLIEALLYGPPTHRAEMSAGAGPLAEAVAAALRMYRRSHYHAEAVPGALLRPLVEATLLLPLLLRVTGLGQRLARRWPPLADLLRPRRAERWLWLTYAAILAVVLLYGLWRWEAPQAQWLALGLPAINLGRVHWLLPLLWYLAFVLAVARLLPVALLGRRRATLLVLALCAWQGAKALGQHQAFVEADRSGLTYRQFFAEPLFQRLRAELGAAADAPVASLGLHPAIAQYNGFRTLDAYLNVYPLAYKQAFRAVIAPALAADPDLARAFDTWGNRLYLLNSELVGCVYACRPGNAPDAVTLLIDPTAFRALGGRFILSAVVISNAEALGLVARGILRDAVTPLVVHLYELPPGD
jgi:hypothetical protein